MGLADLVLSFPPVIELNVGGTHYTTSLLTLTKCKDNMLSAMFSGNYDVTLDKGGRYFIDADGDYFIYILNYLRYGELPPPQRAERVYMEAVYFGVHSLIEELNQYPDIVAAIQRDKFRAQFPGYSDCISSILSTALQMNSEKVDTSSSVVLLLYARENQSDDENFRLFHICLYDSDHQREITPDVKLGQWRNNSSEQDVFRCLLYDLEKKGFFVTGYCMGKCLYKSGENECRKLYYKLTFHWWKS
ncbi:hypothetical protein ACJMK2_043965 [Sinanodonta woodiana]|uniref:BTB domain-containing protein n=1 Tax=Sinanodonta woodiana TaxID=1069815 RepID=A0ABD3VYJ0_SINWO